MLSSIEVLGPIQDTLVKAHNPISQEVVPILRVEVVDVFLVMLVDVEQIIPHLFEGDIIYFFFLAQIIVIYTNQTYEPVNIFKLVRIVAIHLNNQIE